MDDFTRTVIIQLATSEQYIHLPLEEKIHKIYCQINHIEEKSDQNSTSVYDKFILENADLYDEDTPLIPKDSIRSVLLE